MTELELQHRTQSGQPESGPSPFLTDRESAELTAVSFMGPLALVAFDTEPQVGIPQFREVAELQPTEVPDTLVEEFTRTELLTVMRQQHTVAAAAIMFAESHYN